MPIPPFEHSEITDRVRAGRNPLTAEEVQTLIEDGVTHVLDLREPHEWSDPWIGQQAIDEMAAHGIVRRHLPVEDMGTPTGEDLSAAVAFIEEALADPAARVYVHCRAGIERTACVLVAWYAAREAVGFERALADLRTKREVLRPSFAQERAVKRWIDERQSE